MSRFSESSLKLDVMADDELAHGANSPFAPGFTGVRDASAVSQFVDQVWGSDADAGEAARRDMHGRGGGNEVDIDLGTFGASSEEWAPESTSRFVQGGHASGELSIRLGSGSWVPLTNYLAAGSAETGATEQVWTQGATQYAALDAVESASSVFEVSNTGQAQPAETAAPAPDSTPATSIDEVTASPELVRPNVVLSEGSSTLVVLERENARSTPDEMDDDRIQRPEVIELGTARKALSDLIDADRLEEERRDDFLDSPASPQLPIVVDAGGTIGMLKVQLADIGGPVQRVFGYGNTQGTSGSDKIDLSDVLQSSGYDPLKDDLSNYARVQLDNEGNMVLGVDTSGSGTAFTDVVVLHADEPIANGTVPMTSGLATVTLDQVLDDSVPMI